MRILVLADNDDFAWAGPEQPVDIVVSCGDVCDSLILSAVQKCSAARAFAVKGNHDPNDPFPAPITDLHLQVATLPNGLRIGGLNGCWRYKPKGPFLYSQDVAAELAMHLPCVDILVAHNSPKGIHEADDCVHQGFVGLSSYILHHSPSLLIHGHQHIDMETMVGRTRVIGVYRSAVVEV